MLLVVMVWPRAAQEIYVVRKAPVVCVESTQFVELESPSERSKIMRSMIVILSANETTPKELHQARLVDAGVSSTP